MTGQIYLRKGGERINNMKSRMLAGRMFFAMLVPAVGYCAYPTIEEAQTQEEAARTGREARLHEILAARNLQLRVAEANRTVGDYRREVLAICARSVAGCRGMMNEEEFSVFTNQVVTASGANADEQRILFQYVDSVGQ